MFDDSIDVSNRDVVVVDVIFVVVEYNNNYNSKNEFFLLQHLN